MQVLRCIKDWMDVLLWTLGRRIGSTVIQSRKTKIICIRVYFWRWFSPFLGNSRTVAHPPTEKPVEGYFWRWFSPFLGNSRTVAHPLTEKPVEGTDTYLNPGKKQEQLLLQISNSVGTLCGYEHIKNVWAWLWVGQWVWPGGMWLDITPYTHSTFLSWDITCNLC